MAYKNLTISGLPGCGSTTLMKMLKDKLGWTAYSGGEFMREYAISKGYFDPKETVHHDATAYPDDFDRQVDYAVRERLQKEEHHIIEAWLSGFLAQQVPNILKVLVVCSDHAVRIDRIVNRDMISVADAKNHVITREAKNRKKWQDMYAKEWHDWVVVPKTRPAEAEIDFWHPSLYDLVIDTYRYSREETLDLVLHELKI
jgi:CMP/dCMP kinase